ncbi:hypothetical protein COEREDRAFT_79908 [Coemansia reversa NRRL 1564]|uniref:Uncharacterized protein n=1 Tax=Coemansia reversa (strain ATCC 12441 / NRRL 1564) TaxID=763665 RepID=A0A2G5BHI5_COERN|nr:hypothetical protein COEREDRAFT_79908 [Coemansia reversa NRRL 1564]|eukprot:PIA18455.1 hypothetical protein COEREDRAFT_79908 [Coemansia reversa NRRL 1564]
MDSSSLSTPTATSDTSTTSEDDASTTSPNINCPNSTLACDDGQIGMLLISGTSCSWECQPDPLFKKKTNKKGAIIGGSLGVTVFVLTVLLALLLRANFRKRRRERAMYIKDTADLASELSDTPLLKHVENTYPVQNTTTESANSQFSTSTSTNASSGIKRASVFGFGSRARQSEKPDAFFVAKPPNPGDSGTEMTMDIVDRLPNNDPTLTIANGTAPYRQEKTASAYPLLELFSHPPDLAATMDQYSLGDTLAPLPNYFVKEPKRKRTVDRKASSLVPNHHIAEYEAARLSGNAALDAARLSAASSHMTATFDPFHTIPSVQGSPLSQSSRSINSRRNSDKKSKSSSH